jgi:regulator of protease activity HflC (stomatin/prohibitin superfamily)
MRARNSFIAVAVMVLAACTTVKPGYVGIKVNNFGSNKGVSDLPIVTGLVMYNPMSTDVYEFPTFIQTIKWSSTDEGNKGVDESLTFNSREGATVKVDVGLSVAFQRDSVPAVFVEFRKPPEEIIDGYVRNRVREAFSVRASKMAVTDIFGAGKSSLIDSVSADLKRDLGKKGILIDNVSVIGKMHVDPAVEASINAVLTAAQRSIEAENKVKQAQAEAEQAVATSRGDSASAVIEASGKAQANVILARSVSPELVEYQKIQKWNGELPQVSGGTPMISISPKEKP